MIKPKSTFPRLLTTTLLVGVITGAVLALSVRPVTAEEEMVGWKCNTALDGCRAGQNPYCIVECYQGGACKCWVVG